MGLGCPKTECRRAGLYPSSKQFDMRQTGSSTFSGICFSASGSQWANRDSCTRSDCWLEVGKLGQFRNQFVGTEASRGHPEEGETTICESQAGWISIGGNDAFDCGVYGMLICRIAGYDRESFRMCQPEHSFVRSRILSMAQVTGGLSIR